MSPPSLRSPKTKGTSRASKPRKSATKSKSPPKAGATGKPASWLIDQRIRDLGGWRGETLARMRALILEADPEMTEEWKWMGTPVWSHHGIVCTGEAYARVVKLTFARGARIPDPSRLFNSSLEGNTRRAIDIHEGEKIAANAVQGLVKAAVAYNGPRKQARKPASASVASRPRRETARRSSSYRAATRRSRRGRPDAPCKRISPRCRAGSATSGSDSTRSSSGRGAQRAQSVKWNSPFYGTKTEMVAWRFTSSPAT